MKNATSPMLVGLLAFALLAGMESLVKSLAPSYPTTQIAFLRTVALVCWMAPVILLTRQAWPPRSRYPAHLLRAALMMVTTLTLFFALGRLPLAELFAITLTSPLFIALFGAVLLKERVRPLLGVALASGFVGMLVIAFGGDGHTGVVDAEVDWWGLGAAVLSPVAYALGIVLLRSQALHEPPVMIVMVQGIALLLLLAPLTALDFTLPSSATDWSMFAGVGLFAAAGHLCIAYALSRTTAARFAVLEYTGLLWAAAFGYVFFSEVPGWSVWAGASLIVLGCALSMRIQGRAASAD